MFERDDETTLSVTNLICPVIQCASVIDAKVESSFLIAETKIRGMEKAKDVPSMHEETGRKVQRFKNRTHA